MQLFFTLCNILDVTWPQKLTLRTCGSVWSLWVQVNSTWTMSLRQCLLACRRINLCFNKYLKASHINTLRDLQWSAAPALHTEQTFDSADQIYDLVQVLADLYSSFVRKQLNNQSGCVHLRSIERVRGTRSSTQHRQWFCNEKAIVLLAGRRSEILEGCCKLLSIR